MSDKPLVRDLGETPYRQTLDAMRRFTADRLRVRQAGSGIVPAHGDEIWLTSHPPTYTLGLDGNTRHLHDAGGIPVVATERGGQITYHGPGQVIAYLMIDLRTRRLGVRQLVCRIEAGVIDCLAGYGVTAVRRPGAPGLYVGDPDAMRKIASVGLKISGGFSYHGVALNGRMDLEPFARIDPCGFPGLQMTDVSREASTDTALDLSLLSTRLGRALVDALER